MQPYIPTYDSHPLAVPPPSVVADISVGDLGKVAFSPEARDQLSHNVHNMDLYSNADEAEAFVVDTLRTDVRSTCKRLRAEASGARDVHHVYLDNLRIDFEIGDEETGVVVTGVAAADCKQRERAL